MVELYEKMLQEAKTDQDRELFGFLIKEEKKHYQIFSDIIEHLLKAEQWVEDAEFWPERRILAPSPRKAGSLEPAFFLRNGRLSTAWPLTEVLPSSSLPSVWHLPYAAPLWPRRPHIHIEQRTKVLSLKGANPCLLAEAVGPGWQGRWRPLLGE